MVLSSRTRRISWAGRGSHSIEIMMVFDRKTEIIKMSKNVFFYMGPGGTQDHRGPHKTPEKIEHLEKQGKSGGGPGGPRSPEPISILLELTCAY